jgi:hypothetical protein
MKTIVIIVCAIALAAACSDKGNDPGSGNGSDSPDAGSGSNMMPDAHDIMAPDSGTNNTADCLSDSCVCPTNSGCEHTCQPGGNPCHVQCSPGLSCDVTCEATEECHVEALSSTSVTVDCAGASECHVTCPASGCTVENCVGSDCIVSCGIGGGTATRTGSTATCP